MRPSHPRKWAKLVNKIAAIYVYNTLTLIYRAKNVFCCLSVFFTGHTQNTGSVKQNCPVKNRPLLITVKMNKKRMKKGKLISENSIPQTQKVKPGIRMGICTASNGGSVG